MMDLTIERSGLIKALARANDVVERRGTVPILVNVLLDASGEMLRITATDLDLQIVEVTEAAIAAKGVVTVSARTLFDIARKLPDGAQVRLLAGDGKLAVTGGRARFSLPTLPVADFPLIAEAEMPTQFMLPVGVLKRIIDRVRFAVSTEKTRYYLNGIYLHAGDAFGDPEPMLRAAATDGHRLALIRVPLPDGAEDMPGVIVPLKCLSALRKLLDDAEAESEVEIALSETKIRFHLGDAVLTSKLIDGTFPDYTRVIPTANDKLLRLDPASLALGIDRVATIASDKTRAVKMAVARNVVTLSVTSAENGTAAEEVPGDYAGEAIEIGFNARFMLDVLAQIGGDSAEVHLADNTAPTLIREHADSESLFVVMPMRV